jgi:hypothetical protein
MKIKLLKAKNKLREVDYATLLESASSMKATKNIFAMNDLGYCANGKWKKYQRKKVIGKLQR